MFTTLNSNINKFLSKIYNKPNHYIPTIITPILSVSNAESKIADSPVKNRKKLISSINVVDLISKSTIYDKFTHILFTGTPGSGKSTAMAEIGRLWATMRSNERRFDSLFILHLSLLDNPLWKTKVEYAPYIEEHFLACFIHYCIKSEKLDYETSQQNIRLSDVITLVESTRNKKMILIDGYDNFNKDQNLILEQAFQYANVIVTARFELAFLRHHKFQLYLDNTGLDDYGIELFINSMLDENSQLFEFLNSNEAIKEICHNPLNLNILCKIWKKDSNLLHNGRSYMTITELYEHMIYWMTRDYVEKIEEREPVEEHIIAHPILQFMQEKAYNKLFKGTNPELHDKYRENIAKTLPQNLIVEAAIDRFGLLEIKFKDEISKFADKIGSINYEFSHETFQEFMAAVYLKEALISTDKNIFNQAIREIALHSIEKKYLIVMKFLAGLIINMDCQHFSGQIITHIFG